MSGHAVAVAPSLHRALLEEGFPLPEECADVHVTMPVDGIFQIHYSVNVTDENLARLGRALTRIGESTQSRTTTDGL